MKTPRKGLDAYSYTVIALLTAIAVFTFPESTSKTVANEIVATPIKTIEAPKVEAPTPKPDPFTDFTLTGKSAYVYDETTGKVLYAKNENAVLPLASITKLMTAITALEMNRATSTVIISKESLATDGDTGLLSDEHWDLNALLSYTLVVSSNDGATAIASSLDLSRADFIQKMNEKAHSLNYSHMSFYNESGLDETTSEAGGYGTAKEVASLLTYAYDNHPDVVGATKDAEVAISSQDGFTHSGKNTDILVNKIPNLLAGKTGYTGLAGGNLAILFTAKNNHRIAVVVLGSGYDERFTDVEKLVHATITSFNEK